ncbi:MAG: methylated-DNA--[protein]-cysteine S-methyltransferase [Desulfomonilia bacterium]|nr:methylated-DNA--[protein]-cysteine S-methyltransferase [Desulfomonilia bacterium]
MSELFFLSMPSRFGTLCIVWQVFSGQIKIRRIFLSNEQIRSAERTKAWFPRVQKGSCEEVEQLALEIRRFLMGEDVAFDLEMMMFEECSAFQQAVLRTEHAIPRGKVNTYGRIARHLGQGCPRSVGTALALNPFPLVIPCHRTIRADGSLGGFQGGSAMKRALLEYEGITFTPDGTIMSEHVFS